MKKIVFVIRALMYGGAERQLITLAKALCKEHEVTVVYFYGGPMEKEFADSTVNCIHLEKRGRWDFLFIFRIFKYFKPMNPDVIHGYMEVGNIFSILLKPFFPKTKIVWGIRASNVDFSRTDWFVRLADRVERLLARFADLIIFNSKAGLKIFEKKGFPTKNAIVIPNGIDLDRFQPDIGCRQKFRKELNLGDEILIGNVGRLAPQKDHTTFIHAAAILLKSRNDVKFVCVGGIQDQEYTKEIKALTEELGLKEKLIWLGSRSNMSEVYNGLDILTSSSSWGEGFSNVVGEAMACGVPSVVTDVGDSSWIIGDLGVTVPPNNPEALAEGWVKCIEGLKENRGNPIRAIIKNNFSVEKLVERTKKALGLNSTELKEKTLIL